MNYVHPVPLFNSLILGCISVGTMSRLKVYYDLMSQPSRAVVMFCKLAKIPYEDHPVALRKGKSTESLTSCTHCVGLKSSLLGISCAHRIFVRGHDLKEGPTQPGVPCHRRAPSCCESVLHGAKSLLCHQRLLTPPKDPDTGMRSQSRQILLWARAAGKFCSAPEPVAKLAKIRTINTGTNILAMFFFNNFERRAIN